MPLNPPKPQRPPAQSTGVLSDIRCFFLNKPALPTLIQFHTEAERQNYSHRIMQRIGIDVSEYVILNLHQIGINAPVQYVFEELMQWNGDSTCWPNHLAQVERIDERLEAIRLFLCGWRSYPFGFRRSFFGLKWIPLFDLNARRIQRVPPSSDCDNARYLLYDCSGGYPIGIFAMYARSSIAEQHETEATQVFLAVGFNFYGKESLSKAKLVNRTWERIHDRVTANVMNRFKRLCEWRFNQIQDGSGSAANRFSTPARFL